MAVTASPALLIVSAVLLLAAVYAPVPPERWANEAGRFLGSDRERFGWTLLTQLWLVAMLIVFLRYARIRALLTAGTGLLPPWRDYLTVTIVAIGAYALRFAWAAALRWLFQERLALRAIERWRRARHVDEEGGT